MRRHPLAVTSRAAVAVLTLLVGTREAGANGRFPAANQLVAHPEDPTQLVLRATFGLLFSRDNGSTWDLVCEKGIGYSGIADPAVGITRSGTVVAGTFEGLAVTQDRGCGWRMAIDSAPAGLGKPVFIDVVVRPDDPSRVLALDNTYIPRSQDEAGASKYNTVVYRTIDDGTTWSPLGQPLDPNSLFETIEVAPSKRGRIYLSGIDQLSGGVLYVSDDDGGSWTKRSIPLTASERSPFVAAVDPRNADRLYVRTNGPGVTRLLVSDNAGVDFRSVHQSDRPLLGFALSADGSQVFIGNGDGLLMASTSDFQFVKKSSLSVVCLTLVGARLWACSTRTQAGGFALGVSEDDGVTFTPKLQLADVRGPLECPAGTSATQCYAEWPTTQRLLRGQASEEAGTSLDGGPPPVDAGPGAAPVSGEGGCSCTQGAAAGAGAAGALATALLACAALVARLRRR